MRVARLGLVLLLTHEAFPTAQQAQSQSPTAAELPRFEVGFQATDLRTGCVGQRSCYLPSAGLGVSAAMNLTPHVAVEANWNDTVAAVNGSTIQAGGP